MTEPPAATETPQDVPDWAVKVVQTNIREYRYTGDYLQGTDSDKILIGLRRGDKPLGHLMITHTTLGPKHFLRVMFESRDRKVTEKVTARSLAQLQTFVPLLMEQICRYGCSLDPKWCDYCTAATRHREGQFRGLAAARAGESTDSAPS